MNKAKDNPGNDKRTADILSAQMSTLYETSRAINAATSVDEILDAVLQMRESAPLSGVSIRVITAWDAEGYPLTMDTYALAVMDGLPNKQIARGLKAGYTGGLLDDPEALMIFTDPDDPASDIPDLVRQSMLRMGHRSVVTTGLLARNVTVPDVRAILGFISLSSPLPWSDVPEELTRMTHAIAGQVAVALDNLLLRDAARQRTEQLERLTRVEAELSRAENEEDILKAVVDVLPEGDSVRATLVYGESPDESGQYQFARSVAVWAEGAMQPDDPALARPVPFAALPFLSLWEASPDAVLFIENILDDPQADPELRQSAVRFGYVGAIAIPLRSANFWHGVVLLAWPEAREFSPIERFLFRRTRRSLAAVVARRRSYLEQQRLRAESERRVLQLQTASEVSRYTSSILDLAALLPKVVELVKERFALYYVGVFLVDDSNRWAVLRAGTGAAGKEMLERGHRFEIGGPSMIGTCVAERAPQLPVSVDVAAAWLANPLLPETRSEIALPLTSGDNVLGAMTFQSTQPQAFSESDIVVLRTVSDQLTNAILNARLFADAQRRLEEVQRLQRRYALEGWQGYLEEQDVFGYTYDLDQVQPLPMDRRHLVDTADDRDFEQSTKSPGADAPSVAQAFDLPQELWGQEVVVESGTEGSDGAALRATLPLRGEPVGLMSFESPGEPRDWTEDDLALLDSVRDQIALALENRMLFEQTQRALSETQQREAEVRFLQEVATFLNETDDVSASRWELLARLRTFVPVDALTLTTYDARSGQLRGLGSARDLDTLTEVSDANASLGFVVDADSASAWVVREGRYLLEDDLRQERTFPDDVQLVKQGLVSRIVLPLMLGARTLGTLNLVAKTSGVFSRAGVLPILQQVAAQVASAMERANLFRQTRSALGESQALYEASSALSQARSYDAVLRGIMEHTLLSESAMGEIALFTLDPETGQRTIVQTVASWSSEPSLPTAEIGRRLSVPERPVLVLLESENRLICEDITIDARFDQTTRDAYLDRGIRAFIAVSLITSGEKIGVLQLNFATPYHPSELESRLYDTTAEQAAVVLSNRQLLQLSQQRAEQLSSAVELAGMTTSLQDRDTLLNQSIAFLQQRFDLYYVGIFLLDEAGQWAELRAGSGEPGRKLMRMGHRLEVGGSSMIGQSIAYRESRFSLDIASTDEHFVNPLLPDTRSEGAIPLISRGQPIGALTIQSARRFAFTPEDISTLELMANQLANVIESTNLYERSQNTLAETTNLYRIAQRVADARTVTEVLEAAVEGIAQREEPDVVTAGILLPVDNPTMLKVTVAWDRTGSHMPITEYPLDRIQRLYDTLRLESRFTTADATQDPMVDEFARDMYRRLGLRAMAAFQLDVRGLQYGTIMIHSRKAREFSTAELRFYENVARQAFVALESINLVTTTEAEAERRAVLNEVLQTASSSLEPHSLMRDVGKVVALRLERPVIMWEWDGEAMALVAAYEPAGRPIAGVQAFPKFSLNRMSLFDVVVRSQQLRHIDFSDENQRFLPASVAHLVQDWDEGYVVPLLARDTVMGLMMLGRFPDDVEFDLDQQNFIQSAAVNIGVAMETARLYQEAQETAEKLQELDQLKSEFLANMSHELRTPLNSIIGFSRVILKGIDGPLTDMQKTDLTAIYQSGQQLLQLINDILDISKIEAGKMEFVYEPTDLEEIIESVITTSSVLVEDKPIEILSDLPESLPTVMADGRRVRQVITNVISNAAKYTEEGHIKASATYDDYQVIVSVQDTGIGIPEEKYDAVFEQFQQVDSSSTRRYSGTGLGLPLSKRFIEYHGGDMWFESVVGQGSTFYFSLPIEGPSAKPPEESDAASEGPAVSHTVLTVDDDEAVVRLFRRYLERRGYSVFGLTSTDRVVEEAKHLKPFAITLDIMMPDKDGWAIIQELKADPETRDIPIIVCSIVSDTDKGLSMGVADYLVKPIMEQDLLNALARLEDHLQQRDGHVLLVDDNPDDRKLLHRILSDAGYDVAEADGGADAIAQIHVEAPKLVVLDLMMPDIDGFAVLENLKMDASTRDIPVVVVTAKELEPEERSRLQQRVEALLQKGLFDQEQLLEDVADALKQLAAKHSKLSSSDSS